MSYYVDAIKELAYLPKETASVYLIDLINRYQEENDISFEEAYSDLTGVYVDALLWKS